MASSGTITDIHNPWRDALLPASFRSAHFHVEVGSRSNGRRIAMHEFPKKEYPYAEDMGRRAKTFTVRAYCISYPYTMANSLGGLSSPGLELYNVDYRVARDLLLSALEQYGQGTLQLPTFIETESVVVMSYRLSEEERFGGYCVFDIEFAEFGIPPQNIVAGSATAQIVNQIADLARANAAQGMTPVVQKPAPAAPPQIPD